MGPEITPSELADCLNRLGRPVSSRALRDWWASGLLPHPARHGRGQGPGVYFSWDDASIVDRAASVADMLALRSRKQGIVLDLWFAGFEVAPSIVRPNWLASVDRLRAQLTLPRAVDVCGYDEPEDAGDAYGTMVRRVSRAFSKKNGIDFDVIEPVLLEAGSLFLDPRYDETALPVNEIKILVSRADQIVVSEVERFLSDDKRVKKIISWLRANVSLGAIHRLIASLSDREIITAHNHWRCVGHIIRSVTSQDSSDLFGIGLTTAKRLSIALGPIGLVALAWAGRSQFSERVAGTGDILMDAAFRLEKLRPLPISKSPFCLATDTQKERDSIMQDLRRIWNW